MAEHTPDKETKVDIDALLKQIGSRTTPDAELTAKSKAKVQQHWQQMVQKQRQQRKQKYLWAMAASVLMVFTVSLMNFNQPTPQPAATPFAVVQNSQGTAEYQQGNQWLPIEPNSTLVTGTRIRTLNDSHLNIQLSDHSELRIASNTSLTTGSNMIELQHGQIYHDTDVAQQAAALTIKTSQAEVQHIGTRYLVNKQNDVLKVAVRSGQVNMTSEDASDATTLQSNQVATLGTTGETKISTVNSYDGLWDWTFSAQPAYALNGKSLYEFVKWYAHQTGLTIDWQNLESPAKRVRLQGDIHNMTSEQAIKTVFYATQYTYSIEDGVLQIKQQNQ
ncbi:MAG: FecR domain-containing protein [Xanthomonadales bacterium]|nr:FecR domain-containing protein [Xanthomonadales bacterium]